MKTEIIAEIAQAHDGSLGILHSYIDALQGSGIDTIKFQMHIASAESSSQEPFRLKFSYQDDTRYDYWKRMELTMPQWHGVKEHCERAGFNFLCSPFSIAAVEQLEALGAGRYKVGSGEVTDMLLLERLARTGKPVILSSGMSSMEELDRAIDFLKHYGNPLSILQCSSRYPAPPESWGLNLIREFQDRYHLPVGLSDHSGTIFPSLAAVALGASLLEFHVVFDRRIFGPDAKASVTIDETRQLVAGVRMIEEALSHPVDKSENTAFSAIKAIFEKALAVRRELKAGHILSTEDLEAKKPATAGLSAAHFQAVVGRKLKHDLSENDFITEDDLA